MLRQQQDHEGAESEVTRVRRKWGWPREHRTDARATEQVHIESSAAEEIEPHLTALQQAISRRKRARRVAAVGAGITLSGVVSALLPLLATGHPEIGLPGLWFTLSLVFGGETLMLTSLLRGEMPLRAAVSALANTDDLRAVGPLAEALTLGEPSYSFAVSALIRLLPRLQPSDVGLLNATQLACLRRALKHSSSRFHFWRYYPHFAAVLRRALTILYGLLPTEPVVADVLIQQQAPGVEALLDQFQTVVRQRQKNAVAIGGAAVLGATTAIANIVVQALTPYQLAVLPWIATGSVSLTVLLSFRGLFRLRAMMNELANAGDLRVVGLLIEIAAIHDGNANPTAAHLLTRLLTRLQASDAALLTDGQRAALGRALTSNVSNPEFLIAALKALEQVGDGSALPSVENLATGRIKTADPKRVQAAARECLPFLQTRFDQQRASQTLLRASAVSETPPDTLLRPAQGVAAVEDADLLRPGDPTSAQPTSPLDPLSWKERGRGDCSLALS